MSRNPIIRSRYCPACGAPDLACAQPRKRSSWKVCETCSTWIFCPSREVQAYPADYYGGPAAKFSGWAQALRKFFHRERARWIQRLVPSKKSTIYDVGCGDGLFLQEAAQLGLSIRGFEPESTPRKQAETRLKINLDPSLFQSLKTSKAAAITCWQVIEHLANPQTFLLSCRQHLKEGGLLALSTVNLASVQARCFGEKWLHLDPPRHLWIGSLPVLSQMVKDAGFRIVHVRHNPLEFGPIGWIDSILNCVDTKRDRLLLCLKLGCREPGDRLVWLLSIVLTPLAMILSVAESLLGRPATFEIYARAERKRARRQGG